MRPYLGFAGWMVLTVLMIVALDRPWGSIPPIGRFMSPQQGFWMNAEAAESDAGGNLTLEGLKGSVEVVFDSNLVPHVFAEHDDDLYFAQGFLHARYRLFQMDLQTRVAAGRLSEIVGEKALRFDRKQRRLGMVYAAENAVRAVESDPLSKRMFESYARGINAYISSLSPSDWPLEYKLLDIEPETWTTLRSALLLKMMAKMLSSDSDNDLPYSEVKSLFGYTELESLYPSVHDSLVPIVPKGTNFPSPLIRPVPPASADSLYYAKESLDFLDWSYSTPASLDAPVNGSNNWVVAGSRTSSGRPILCNDPHLDLTLPSIWYEMQLTSPTGSTYGATLPGCPFVIIGFNNDVSWGVTNSQRDVKDYYQIIFRNRGRDEYQFSGRWKKAHSRVERIHVRGQADFLDTVTYTVFGPVMYDSDFYDSTSSYRNLAVRWTAHDQSNEGLTFYRLNRAHNYADYHEAISTFQCPGQNFVFASRTGEIALWQQGRFPARWKGQGMFVMPGYDSTYAWQGYIPQQENPHAVNPKRGFLQSANQRPADATYPYFIPGNYITARGVAIDRFLGVMRGATPQDMMRLQNNNFNVIAEDARPLLLAHVRPHLLTAAAQRYLQIVTNWDLQADVASTGQTVFDRWWDSVNVGIWKDELEVPLRASVYPREQTTLEMLLRDTSMRYVDDMRTPRIESLSDIVTASLNKAAQSLSELERAGSLAWGPARDPSVNHLLRLPALSRTGLPIGGDGNIINAMSHSHGPSWRMIVHMTTPIEAYGIFPGGQSGNPGSYFYDNNVDRWAHGRYNRLWYATRADKNGPRARWTLRLEAPAGRGRAQ